MNNHNEETPELQGNPKTSSFKTNANNRPLAFTIDFDGGGASTNPVALQRHQELLEKYEQQKKLKLHRRGQSLHKIDVEPSPQKPPLSERLPRKAIVTNGTATITQKPQRNGTNNSGDSSKFIDGALFNFERSSSSSSETLSDAGTYTLEGDNYSEEQKRRMSIDYPQLERLENVTSYQKTEQYVNSLQKMVGHLQLTNETDTKTDTVQDSYMKTLLSPILSPTSAVQESPLDTTFTKFLQSEQQPCITDKGSVVSVTTSGAFRRCKTHQQSSVAPPTPVSRRNQLVKSETHVEAYVEATKTTTPQLTASIINVNNICKVVVDDDDVDDDDDDDGEETESYLRPTQNFINSLQQRLNSGHQQDKRVNHLIKQTRHNSLDRRPISNSSGLHKSRASTGVIIDQTSASSIHRSNNVNNRRSSPIRRSSSFSNRNHHQSLIKTHHQRTRGNTVADSRPLFKSTSMASVKTLLPAGGRQQIDHSQYGDATTTTTTTATDSSSDEETGGGSGIKLALGQQQRKKDLSNTRYNRAFSLRRGRLDEPSPIRNCPNTPEMRRKFAPPESARSAITMDRNKPTKTNDVQSRYLLNVSSGGGGSVLTSTRTSRTATTSQSRISGVSLPKSASSTSKVGGNSTSRTQKDTKVVFSRTDSGRFSMKTMRTSQTTSAGLQRSRRDSGRKSESGGARSNSTLCSREMEFQNWKRRKSYDPLKAAAEGKRKVLEKKQSMLMVQSHGEQNVMNSVLINAINQNDDCDSSPSHSSLVLRSQSFHGTVALDQHRNTPILISSDDDEVTVSPDEGFSLPTPSPSTFLLSPTRISIRNSMRNRTFR